MTTEITTNKGYNSSVTKKPIKDRLVIKLERQMQMSLGDGQSSSEVRARWRRIQPSQMDRKNGLKSIELKENSSIEKANAASRSTITVI